MPHRTLMVKWNFLQFQSHLCCFQSMKFSEDGNPSAGESHVTFEKTHIHTWVYSFSDTHANFQKDKTKHVPPCLQKPAAFCINSVILQPLPPVKNTKQPWWHCSLFAHRGNEVESNPPQLRFLRLVTRDVAAAGRRDPKMLLPAFSVDLVSCRKKKRHVSYAEPSVPTCESIYASWNPPTASPKQKF